MRKLLKIVICRIIFQCKQKPLLKQTKKNLSPSIYYYNVEFLEKKLYFSFFFLDELNKKNTNNV
jgi:hypothetical protein